MLFKGEYTSVWDDGTVTTECEISFPDGARPHVRNIESVDADVDGGCVEEYIQINDERSADNHKVYKTFFNEDMDAAVIDGEAEDEEY